MKTEDTEMMGVPVRIFRPKEASDDKLPGVIYYHGGGWCWDLWGESLYQLLISFVFTLCNIRIFISAVKVDSMSTPVVVFTHHARFSYAKKYKIMCFI